jgi:excisionase family DNA binding protein
VTLTEAAALLGVTADTLRQQVARGRLKARKLGPIWTVTPSEVERYRRESLGKRAEKVSVFDLLEQEQRR